MLDYELKVISDRVGAATSGPWAFSPAYGAAHGREREIFSTHEPELWVARCQSDADVAFIVKARTDVPALLAEVARLRDLLRRADLLIADLEAATKPRSFADTRNCYQAIPELDDAQARYEATLPELQDDEPDGGERLRSED